MAFDLLGSHQQLISLFSSAREGPDGPTRPEEAQRAPESATRKPPPESAAERTQTAPRQPPDATASRRPRRWGFSSRLAWRCRRRCSHPCLTDGWGVGQSRWDRRCGGRRRGPHTLPWDVRVASEAEGSG